MSDATGDRVRGPFDLVIFDCDGVLIDSERLVVQIEAAILADLGWPLSESEIVTRFVGRSAAFMQSEIEAQIGRSLDWDVEFESRYREVFERRLVPVEGVLEVLDALDGCGGGAGGVGGGVSTCVASSGTHERMEFTLGLTGLYKRFAGRIFSTSEVAHGKPAPDVFLHAAERMGVAPHRCAVVEDSVSGVTAGVAAGMTVFAYAGSVTSAPQLARPDVIVFDDMRSLPAHLLGR